MKIGIVGNRRTGKDTVAGFLQEKTPLVHCSFAGFLKDDVRRSLHAVAYELGPTYGSMIQTALQDRNVMGPLWQWWGTELVRRVNPDYWIQRFDQAYRGTENWVATDVRFENEAQYVRSVGGVLIRIQGYGFIPPEDTRNPTHLSETELQSIKCDLIIGNDSRISLAQLRNQVYTVLLPQIEDFFLAQK